MKVLIVNAGSSSLKYQLVDMDNEQMIVKGQVERIAIEGSHLNQKTPDMSKVIDLYEPIPDHVVATKLMLRALLDPEKGVLKSVDEIGAVGHRVLHGGEKRRDRNLEHAAVCFGADRCAKARVAGKGLGQAVHRKAVVFVERECRAVERVDNDVRNAVDQNVDRADLIAHLVEKTPVRDLLGAQAGYAERAAVGERFVR